MRAFSKQVSDPISFSEFVRAIVDNPEVLHLDRHWRPQANELSVQTINFNVLGAVENIHRDFPMLLEASLGCLTKAISDTRIQLNHKTNSAGLLKTLSKADVVIFEKILKAHYELYEMANDQVCKF